MTDDASPENLRKFLESDDPAMRRMGLSMAKGSGVPEELYKNVLGLSLWDPEEENREAAGEMVEEIGLENIPEFPGWLEPFDVVDVDYEVRRVAASVLEGIGKPAVELLITALVVSVDNAVVDALVGIGKPAVEPLIEALSDDHHSRKSWSAVALGEIGDVRAVEPLIKALGDENWSVRNFAATALGKIGDVRAVEPLIKALEDEDEDVQGAAWRALENLGHEWND